MKLEGSIGGICDRLLRSKICPVDIFKEGTEAAAEACKKAANFFFEISMRNKNKILVE